MFLGKDFNTFHEIYSSQINMNLMINIGNFLIGGIKIIFVVLMQHQVDRGAESINYIATRLTNLIYVAALDSKEGEDGKRNKLNFVSIN